MHGGNSAHKGTTQTCRLASCVQGTWRYQVYLYLVCPQFDKNCRHHITLVWSSDLFLEASTCFLRHLFHQPLHHYLSWAGHNL